MKICTSAAMAVLILAAAPAFAEVVVVTNAANADAVSKDQIANVYLGKSTAFTPIDQSDGSAIRGEFYKKVADKDASQAKALWSKLVFTGKASPPKDDEIFSSGNFSKVSPVTRIDDRRLSVGPFYLKARKLYWEYAHS